MNTLCPLDEKFFFSVAQFHLEEVVTCPSTVTTMPRRVEISVRLTVYEITRIFTFFRVRHEGTKLVTFRYKTVYCAEVT